MTKSGKTLARRRASLSSEGTSGGCAGVTVAVGGGAGLESGRDGGVEPELTGGGVDVTGAVGAGGAGIDVTGALGAGAAIDVTGALGAGGAGIDVTGALGVG